MTSRHWWRTFESVFFALTCVCAADEKTEAVHLVRTPDNGLQPQVAVDQKGTVHLVYLVGDPAGCDVYYRSRPAGQNNFSPAKRVNSTPSTAIAVGTVRGAQLALGGDRVHVVWNGSGQAKTSANLNSAMLYSRLSESGESFEPQRNLMTKTINLDGGGSVAADKQGNVYVVWHAHEKGGAEEDETHRGVYVAHSSDFGRTFEPERKVSGPEPGVCGCCGLKAFAAKPGQLAILYRSADAVANRDMILMVSTNSGKSFATRVVGKWKVSTCPMSTPALGAGPGDTLLAMWETDGQVYRAVVNPERLDQITVLAADGKPGERKHPRYSFGASGNGSLLITWVEGTGWEKGGALAWECIGAPPEEKSSGRTQGVPPWTFTAVVPEKNGSFTIIY